MKLRIKYIESTTGKKDYPVIQHKVWIFWLKWDPRCIVRYGFGLCDFHYPGYWNGNEEKCKLILQNYHRIKFHKNSMDTLIFDSFGDLKICNIKKYGRYKAKIIRFLE